jgi:hypothetical protein
MQAGLWVDACKGEVHSLGGTGGENLSGGDCAKGMPKNLFIAAVAEGRAVVVPTTTPASIVTVGSAALEYEIRAAMAIARAELIPIILWCVKQV